MQNYEKIVESLLDYSEEEWFEFKENWFEPHGIGGVYFSSFKCRCLKGKDERVFYMGN